MPLNISRFGNFGQTVVRRQILDPLVGLGFFIGAIEIFQRERHVVDETLQQIRQIPA